MSDDRSIITESEHPPTSPRAIQLPPKVDQFPPKTSQLSSSSLPTFLPTFIAKGSYSRVYRIGTDRVIKIYDDELTRDIPFYIIREIAMLQKLKGHPNILPILNMKFHQGRIQLLLPYCETSYRKLRSRHLFLQIVNVLYHCHRLGIVHRDLKPDNVLIHQGRVYLIDFNISRRIEHDQILPTREITSLWYRPPEVLIKGNTYGRELDIWSLGCLFAELLCHGQVLFRVTSELDLCHELSKLCELDMTTLHQRLQRTTPHDPQTVSQEPQNHRNDPTTASSVDSLLSPTPEQVIRYLTQKDPDVSASPEAMDLLAKMIQIDPSRRISLEDILEHPYFQRDDRIVAESIPESGESLMIIDHWTRQLIQLCASNEFESTISLAIHILDLLRPLIQLNSLALMVSLNVASKYLYAKTYYQFVEIPQYIQCENEILMLLRFHIDRIDLLNYLNQSLFRTGRSYQDIRIGYRRELLRLVHGPDLEIRYHAFAKTIERDALLN